jgi:uncharacterized protein (DUF4213/DUF364 family)
MRKKGFSLSLVLSLTLLLCVLALAVLGLRNAETARSDAAAEDLLRSIRRAAVSCYAIEGRYPDTLSYLTEHYGVYVDESEFAVGYDVFASNLMPDVTVMKR